MSQQNKTTEEMRNQEKRDQKKSFLGNCYHGRTASPEKPAGVLPRPGEQEAEWYLFLSTVYPDYWSFNSSPDTELNLAIPASSSSHSI